MSTAARLHRGALALAARAALALPAPLRRLLFGPPRRNDRGDALDADAHVLARLDELTQPPLTSADVAASRLRMKRSIAVVARPRAAGVSVSERSVAGRPARHYLPAGAADAGPLPLLVFYHGGGWALGDLDTHDGLCSRLCAEVGVAVLAVDYRLAPEHPCPAAFDDALAAFRAAQADAASFGADPTRVLVGGDSAGGNLAAAVAMACRDAGTAKPAAQVLVFPATDLRRLTASHRTCASGPLLTSADVDFFLAAYNASDLADPRVSPGAADDVAGLPPTVITTCGFDPLRDEGEDYARRLSAARVPTRHLHHAELMHGYTAMDGALPAADAAVAALVAAIAATLADLSTQAGEAT